MTKTRAFERFELTIVSSDIWDMFDILHVYKAINFFNVHILFSGEDWCKITFRLLHIRRLHVNIAPIYAVVANSTDWASARFNIISLIHVSPNL